MRACCQGKYEVEDMLKFITEEASEPLWQETDRTGVKAGVKTEL